MQNKQDFVSDYFCMHIIGVIMQEVQGSRRNETLVGAGDIDACFAMHRAPSRRIASSYVSATKNIVVVYMRRESIPIGSARGTPRPSKSDDDPVSNLTTGNERNEYLAVISSFSLFSDLTVTRIWFCTRA